MIHFQYGQCGVVSESSDTALRASEGRGGGSVPGGSRAAPSGRGPARQRDECAESSFFRKG